MTRRQVLAFLTLGALVALSFPARASHTPPEPTNPIVGAELRVFNYAEGLSDPEFAVDCADGVVETFDHHHVGGSSPARIEGYVVANNFPSEHFIVRLDANFRPRFPQSSTANPDWNITWPHQNIPPHPNRVKPGEIWKAINANQYFSVSTTDEEIFKPAGIWEIIMTVTGQESGTVLTKVCRFNTGT